MKKIKKKNKRESYISGVKSEMKKVSWPTKKEVLKYTIATVIFILIVLAFFLLIIALFSAVGAM